MQYRFIPNNEEGVQRPKMVAIKYNMGAQNSRWWLSIQDDGYFKKFYALKLCSMDMFWICLGKVSGVQKL